MNDKLFLVTTQRAGEAPRFVVDAAMSTDDPAIAGRFDAETAEYFRRIRQDGKPHHVVEVIEAD